MLEAAGCGFGSFDVSMTSTGGETHEDGDHTPNVTRETPESVSAETSVPVFAKPGRRVLLQDPCADSGKK